MYSVMTKGLSVIRSLSQPSHSFIYGQAGAKARWALGTCIPIIKAQKGASVYSLMHTMLKANCREASQSEIYAVTGIFYVLLGQFTVFVPLSMITHPRDLQHYTHGCTWSLCPCLTQAFLNTLSTSYSCCLHRNCLTQRAACVFTLPFELPIGYPVG